jgi:alanine-glyoxylate transaminase/serine-glyoxylate transaminase/serine-pyruvate transaminase
MTKALGLQAEIIKGDWRTGVDADAIEAALRADKAHTFKAVAVVHNETSTGVASNIAAVRRAIDNAKHPALLLVDTISSLGSIDYRHDEWGVDVTVGGSQKGLMLPPGIAFNAISKKALEASKAAKLPRSFLGWDEMLAANASGFFPYTPSTNLLQGLKVALDLMEEEGLDNVFARHDRAALATRRAVEHWGFEIQCRNPAEYSSSLTAVRLPEGHSADRLRREILERANMSLGNGLGPLADCVFRIGHLGDFNTASMLGTLSAVELGLKATGIPYRAGGVDVAIDVFNGNLAPTQMGEAAE